IQAGEPARPTYHQPVEGKQRTIVLPAIPYPAEPAEYQEDCCELKAHGYVGIALAESPTEPIPVVGSHVAARNLPACDKFRKQTTRPANLCGAWEYDVITLDTR